MKSLFGTAMRISFNNTNAKNKHNNNNNNNCYNGRIQQ